MSQRSPSVRETGVISLTGSSGSGPIGNRQGPIGREITTTTQASSAGDCSRSGNLTIQARLKADHIADWMRMSQRSPSVRETCIVSLTGSTSSGPIGNRQGPIGREITTTTQASSAVDCSGVWNLAIKSRLKISDVRDIVAMANSTRTDRSR